MKIVHRSTGRIIAEEEEDRVVVYNELFKRIWEKEGIAIPAFLKNDFNGVEKIKLGERNFSRALFEVYYKFNMNKKSFKLE